MSTILFYSPFNQRSRDTESLMLAFRKQGHRVISLSQQEGDQIHPFLKAHDIEVHSHIVPGQRSGWWYFLRHIIFFIGFCRRHKADIVYSHLEPASFVAAIGQYFVRARVYICRHHIDEGSLYRFDKDIYYRLTYRLARTIIVVSERAKQYMINTEHVSPKKIRHINLAYDFSLYPQPNAEVVKSIRAGVTGKIVILSACRFTEFKRPDVSIAITNQLVKKGFDVSLILLGQGDMRQQLEAQVASAGLTSRVQMPGYVRNVIDYMAAADFFVHPSLLESSCVAVKEAGLVSLPVIVCSGIGDFDEYIVHTNNGLMADQNDFAVQAVRLIETYISDSGSRQRLGENLRQSVLRLFSIENVVHEYDLLNEQK